MTTLHDAIAHAARRIDAFIYYDFDPRSSAHACGSRYLSFRKTKSNPCARLRPRKRGRMAKPRCAIFARWPTQFSTKLRALRPLTLRSQRHRTGKPSKL